MRNTNYLTIITIFLSFFLVSTSSHAGEVKKTIDYGWGLGDKDPYKKRGFTAQITYDSLPELNKDTRILLKIRSKFRHQNAPGFVIRGPDQSVDYTQLEPEWPPPLGTEDIYEGSFSITPREIGTFSFRIRAWGEPFRGSSHNEFSLYLTIDESGKTIHFSNIQDYEYMDNGLPAHPPIKDHQVHIRYSSRGDFSNSFRIVPPPKVNDTSTVYFELTCNRYCPEGVQLSLELTPNLEIITVPSSWVGEVKKGDVYRDSFEIVPTTTDNAILRLNATGDSPSRDVLDKRRGRAQRIFGLFLAFDSSGKVNYVGRKNKYYRSGKSFMSAKEVAKRMGEKFTLPEGDWNKVITKPRVGSKK